MPLLLLATLVLGLNIGTASWNPAAEVANGEILLAMPAAGPGSGPCAKCLNGGQYQALAMVSRMLSTC